MIRLIASDLDGTLLNKDGTLPEEIFDVIRSLKQQGVLFIPASGRQYDNLRSLFYPVRDDIAYICENGAMTVTTGEKHCAAFFEEATAQEIMDDLEAAGLQLLVSLKDMALVSAHSPRSYTDDIIYRLKNTTRVVEEPRLYAAECIKISGFCAGGILPAAEKLQKKWSGRMRCDVAGPFWLDFTLRSKGDALLDVCRTLDIEPKDVMAFGDQENDLPMLNLAGHPYLMQSGNRALKTPSINWTENVITTIREVLSL